jgi:hypothetical protein
VTQREVCKWLEKKAGFVELGEKSLNILEID